MSLSIPNQQAKMAIFMKEEEQIRELIPLERFSQIKTNTPECQILTLLELLCSENLAVSFAVNNLHRLRTVFFRSTSE